MHLTKESEYALQGLAVLVAVPSGQFTPIARVAAQEDLPASFLAKIFRKLSRVGLLLASRGPGSGFALSRSGDTITLREVLEAVEGPELFTCCFLWQGHGDHDRCPLHDQVEPVVAALTARLDAITLADYAAARGVSSAPQKTGE